MEIDPRDNPCNLIEANVVESLEARPVDLPHSGVRDEELLFPSHKEILPLRRIWIYEVGLARRPRESSERRKPLPVLHVHYCLRAPTRMFGHETVLGPDDLAVEVSRQGGVVGGQAWLAISIWRGGRRLWCDGRGSRCAHHRCADIRRSSTRPCPRV